MGVEKRFFEYVAIFWAYLASPIRPQGWQGHKFHNLYFSYPRDASHQNMITIAFQEVVQNAFVTDNACCMTTDKDQL